MRSMRFTSFTVYPGALFLLLFLLLFYSMVLLDKNLFSAVKQCQFYDHQLTHRVMLTYFSGLMEFYCGRFLLVELLLTQESTTMR